MLAISRRLKTPGALFLIYACTYAVGRFLLTFVRRETILFWGLQEAQVVSIGVLAVSLALLAFFTLRERQPRAGQLAPVEAPK